MLATRDSYLAVNKEFCAGPESLSLLDPLRSHVREQMAYQYVENGITPDHALLDEKFKTWADEQMAYQVVNYGGCFYFKEKIILCLCMHRHISNQSLML